VGEHLVMAVDTRAIGHESGAPINQREFVVYTMREGKIAAIIAYPNKRDALEVLGLAK
jgi:ketosteroid isomerase-like protein